MNTFLKRFIVVFLILVVTISIGVIVNKFKNDMSLAWVRVSSSGKTVETACGPIQYTEFGEGPPMLIIHGAGGGYDQGEYFAQIIGGNYRWIAPSRFGFLGTAVPSGADSAMQAQAHACLLDSLGIDRVGVIGVSMGGPSALLFAQQYPQRTNSLALISAASHANPPRPAYLATLFNFFLNDFVYWSMLKMTPEGMLAALGVPFDVQKQVSSEEVTKLHEFLRSMLPMSARQVGQNLEQHMSEFDSLLIRKITAPTLVMHAPDDTLVFFEQGEHAAKNIPGAELVTMDKGGHLALMFTMNSGAKSKLQEFLQKYNNQY